MSENARVKKFQNAADSHWTEQRILKITGGRNYEIRPPGDALFLKGIGLLSNDASMPADSVRKYTQINHMLALLKPALDDLRARHKSLAILDAGCGSSYLSFLLGWYLKHKLSGNFLIVGIDTNEALIKKSRALAATLQLESNMHFETASTGTFQWHHLIERRPRLVDFNRPHLVIGLHACDTATDEAIGLGLELQSDVIATAPCCQAELASKWRHLAQSQTGRDHPLSPIFQAPELRRTIAAEATDMMRVLLLRARGYETTTTEFVESRHSPKNRLILAKRRGRYSKSAVNEYLRLKEHFGSCAIKLEELIGTHMLEQTPTGSKN